MTWEEFEVLFLGSYFLEIICLYLILFLFIWIFFKKNIYCIFDPLNILIINYASVFTVIIFLFYLKKVEESKFLQLLLINCSFLLSLKFFLKIKSKNIKITKLSSIKEFKIFYYQHTVVFLIITFFMIKFVGLKALEDKILAFNNLGFLNYLKMVILPGQIILIIIKREAYKIKQKIDIIILGIIIAFFIISGGKTSIISYILYVSSTYYILYNNNLSDKFLNYKKREIKYLFLSVVIVLILFSIIMKVQSLEKIIERILFRIVSTGDIYFMIYPENVIDKLKKINVYDYYICSIFSPILKRFGYEIRNFGFEVIKNLYRIENPSFGPNARADVILQMNLGYFGFILSILCGYIISMIRKIKTKNIYMLYTGCILIVNAEVIMTDFTIIAMFIFSFLLILPLMYTVTKIMVLSLENNIYKKNKGEENE